MNPLNYREMQLIKAYRAADERGRAAIDDMAHHQVEFVSRPAPQREQQRNVVPMLRLPP